MSLAVICLLLSADSAAWFFLRAPLYKLIRRRPWLLVLEQIVFVALLYLTFLGRLPFFFPLYMGVSIMMNGISLGSLGNTAVTAMVGAFIFAVYSIAPAESLAGVPGGRYESALQHTTIFLILAISSGLAGEFVLGLENLQLRAIGRALARQCGHLSAETHRQLHSRVHGLGDDIQSIEGRLHEFADFHVAERFRQLESRSTDLKKQLRSILNGLEEPEL